MQFESIALLISHLEYSPIFCSMSPSIVYIQADSEKSLNYSGLHFGTAKLDGNFYQHPDAVRAILGTHNQGNDSPLTASEIKKANQIYTWLTENGFLQKSIVVYSSRSKTPLYELDLKGSPKKSNSICRAAEDLIRTHGLEAGRGPSQSSRFFDRYPVVAPSECEPILVGLYRPTYYPSCESIDIVRQSQDQKAVWQKNADEWFSLARAGDKKC